MSTTRSFQWLRGHVQPRLGEAIGRFEFVAESLLRLITSWRAKRSNRRLAKLMEIWPRLDEKQRCSITAYMAAVLDEQDSRLTEAESASLRLTRLRHDHGTDWEEAIDAWLIDNSYLLADFSLGPRTRQSLDLAQG